MVIFVVTKTKVMKLELKHLAPYLPYKISAIHPSINVPILIYGASDFSIINCVGQPTFKLSEIKPILRPLVDLGGFKIEHKNRIVDLTNYISKNDIDLILNKVEFTNLFTLPHTVISRLYEFHFDVYGLLYNGLAIDINTITNDK